MAGGHGVFSLSKNDTNRGVTLLQGNHSKRTYTRNLTVPEKVTHV
jgi:hypothetical protein